MSFSSSRKFPPEANVFLPPLIAEQSAAFHRPFVGFRFPPVVGFPTSCEVLYSTSPEAAAAQYCFVQTSRESWRSGGASITPQWRVSARKVLIELPAANFASFPAAAGGFGLQLTQRTQRTRRRHFRDSGRGRIRLHGGSRCVDGEYLRASSGRLETSDAGVPAAWTKPSVAPPLDFCMYGIKVPAGQAELQRSQLRRHWNVELRAPTPALDAASARTDGRPRSHSTERACARPHRDRVLREFTRERSPAACVDWFGGTARKWGCVDGMERLAGEGTRWRWRRTLRRVALRLPGTRRVQGAGGRIALVFLPTIWAPNGSCGPRASSGWSCRLLFRLDAIQRVLSCRRHGVGETRHSTQPHTRRAARIRVREAVCGFDGNVRALTGCGGGCMGTLTRRRGAGVGLRGRDMGKTADRGARGSEYDALDDGEEKESVVGKKEADLLSTDGG
ncbi:hypothetical protein C8R43DRAFT_1137794 [Mycena crocata]|nr:hypothetical protein C8R43DRAFT_1137794 [Mycena crocata]